MAQVPSPEDSGVYQGACLNLTDTESKHRQELSQQFMALAAIVPGVKMMEETFVLRDSIKYIKELQEREKALEEYSKTMDELSSQSANEPLLEIKAKISGKSVLLRILCEKQEGVVAKILAEIKKLDLSVITSSILPFGTSTLNMTVVALMDNEFDKAYDDIVKNCIHLVVGLCEQWGWWK